jgi:hypothetical protein
MGFGLAAHDGVGAGETGVIGLMSVSAKAAASLSGGAFRSIVTGVGSGDNIAVGHLPPTVHVISAHR